MSDDGQVWPDATPVPTAIMPDDLLPKFKQAATTNGLVDGADPIQYLQSAAEQRKDMAADVAEKAGVAAAGSAAAQTFLALFTGGLSGGATLIGLIASWIDGGRQVKMVLVNNLPTGLTINTDDVHTATGIITAVPCLMEDLGDKNDDSDVEVLKANYVLAREDDLVAAGPGLGLLKCEKNTTWGIGLYGTEGAIHLIADDHSLLPKGLYLGWRVPESGDNNCAISVNGYRSAKEFYQTWINDGSSRQTDGSTNADAGVVAHCAISSVTDTDVSMVVLLDRTAA